MITNADIKKMKSVFATKVDLNKLSKRFDIKFATKQELNALDTKMGLGFHEIIEYIGKTREEIISLLSQQINEFRQEMRDIVGLHQTKLA